VGLRVKPHQAVLQLSKEHDALDAEHLRGPHDGHEVIYAVAQPLPKEGGVVWPVAHHDGIHIRFGQCEVLAHPLCTRATIHRHLHLTHRRPPAGRGGEGGNDRKWGGGGLVVEGACPCARGCVWGGEGRYRADGGEAARGRRGKGPGEAAASRRAMSIEAARRAVFSAPLQTGMYLSSKYMTLSSFTHSRSPLV
jgi:hypothetical protein